MRTDLLSDEAIIEHCGKWPDADYIDGWKACARQVKSGIWGRLAAGKMLENDKLKTENKKLIDLLNLERELSDTLINYLDQNLVFNICVDLDYSGRRFALEAQ